MTATPRFVLMLSSEAAPFAKTGGLADVAGALPLALGRLGHRVLLVLPRYHGSRGGDQIDRFAVTVGGVVLEASLLKTILAEGIDAVEVECPALYDREALYGIGNADYSDNALRFAVLVRAALEYVARDRARPDVLHAHDWQTGLAPVYLKTLYATHPILSGVPSVFTIHNLAYQGLFPPETVPAVDLPWEVYGVEGLEFWGKASYLKGGINFSEVVTTVSRRYAKEIQTPEYGFGFEGILRRRAGDLVGILNGIDVERWNPERDPLLPQPYGVADLSGKAAAREALFRAYDIPVDEAHQGRPVVGMVSRLVDQKGFDLLADVAGDLVRIEATYVLLGSGDPRYEELWRTLAATHPDRVGARIGFDDDLAHLVEGGADIFLMPSRFEPCGLNQMYSLRYGTVPVVRATGGLDDTVEAWNPRSGTGTGFKFHEYSGPALLRALRAAVGTWHKPEEWRSIQQAGMRVDVSWDASARQYVQVYERAITRATGRQA
jgi:starch synthase